MLVKLSFKITEKGNCLSSLPVTSRGCRYAENLNPSGLPADAEIPWHQALWGSRFCGSDSDWASLDSITKGGVGRDFASVYGCFPASGFMWPCTKESKKG